MSSSQIVIISDLDGTLFQKDGVPPENCEEFFKSLEEYPIILATARPPANYIENLGGSNEIANISLDGGVVWESQGEGYRVLYEELLSTDAIDVIVDHVVSDFFVFLGAKHDFDVYYFSDDDFRSLVELKKVPGNTRRFRRFSASDAKEVLIEKDIRAITVFSPKKRISSIAFRAPDLPSVRCYSYPETRVATEYVWWDCVSSKLSKENALDRLLKEKSFSGKIICMGDGVNDYGIMQNADFSLCPSNAAPKIKKITDYVSPYTAGHEFIWDVIAKITEKIREWKVGRKLSG